MRERAGLAGGDLSVESEPGDGTVISVWVPAGAPARQVEGPSHRRPPPRSPIRRPPAPWRAFTWQ